MVVSETWLTADDRHVRIEEPSRIEDTHPEIAGINAAARRKTIPETPNQTCHDQVVPFTRSSHREDDAIVIFALRLSSAFEPEIFCGRHGYSASDERRSEYPGKRAQRGLKLPRGFQTVTSIRARNERDRAPDVVM